MKYTLGFSPCPNDTFIFDALVNGKIETDGIEFEPILEDVETLNKWAFEGKLDFSKISYGALPKALEHYIVLASGGALGNGVGPLLISKEPIEIDDIKEYTIAIPGENTTANLLFSKAFPEAKNKVYMLFSEIEDFVLQGKGIGVIIHESRFTFAEKGLHKVLDLGDYWEVQTHQPIPLGGIVGRRDLPIKLVKKVDSLICSSIEHAYVNDRDNLSEYVKSHAQELSEDVMKEHIYFYVNSFSFKNGKSGRDAVRSLLDVYKQDHPEFTIARDQVFAKDFYLKA